MLSSVSHDLRTPLTSISGHADLLAQGFHGELSEEQRSELHSIKEGARELSRMLDDILSFAQLESGRVDVRAIPIAVSDALARAEALIKVRLIQSQLSLETHSEQILGVKADPDRLQQVLLNLLTNAIKFTPPGGKITVSCSSRDDRILIEVRDTGIGIPEDQLERIFDAFVQLQSGPRGGDHRGVGLGLAISRELTRAMDGELTASSRLGAGSVFTINLPAAARHILENSPP